MLFDSLFHALPQPTIVIRRSHRGLVYAGNDFTLTAEILFSDIAVVDMLITLAISWSRDDVMITSNDHISISSVNTSESGYTGSLTYSPIAISDSGLITATVTVSPSDISVYIYSVTATATEILSVQGIYTYANILDCPIVFVSVINLPLHNSNSNTLLHKVLQQFWS